MLLSLTAAALAALSCGLTLWQWWVARRFPLHVRPTPSPPRSGVTLLKPLKGHDLETSTCLRSWFDQDYTGLCQLLFGVADPNDPVCAMVSDLIAAHPKADAELVICSKPLGANAKVSTLVQLHARARHNVIVISDADVWAPRDLLTHLVAPLAQAEVGVVNCFYQLARPSSLPMKWEAVAINADFWSQVLQAQCLKPLDFALGAVMATTQRHLQAIGGFVALLDYLADDYQLGHRIANAGGQIVLCPVVVECRSSPSGWKEVWNHQLRWTRTIRVCQPGPFFFSILSNATIWPLFWAFLSPSFGTAATALCFLIVRLWTARSNQRRLSRENVPWRDLWLALWKDVAGFAMWALAFLGNRIEWRGRRYRMLRDGRLVPLE